MAVACKTGGSAQLYGGSEIYIFPPEMGTVSGIPVVIIPVMVGGAGTNFVDGISIVLEDIIAQNCVMGRGDEVHSGDILRHCPECVVIN